MIAKMLLSLSELTNSGGLLKKQQQRIKIQRSLLVSKKL
jgi:hypothetical protein